MQGHRSQSPTRRQPPGPAGRCGRGRRTAREEGHERGPGVHGSSPGRLAASYRAWCPTRAASRRKPPPGLTRRGPSRGRRGAKVGNRGQAPKLSVRRLRRLPPLHSPSPAVAKPARAPSTAGAAAPRNAALRIAALRVPGRPRLSLGTDRHLQKRERELSSLPSLAESRQAGFFTPPQVTRR